MRITMIVVFCLSCFPFLFAKINQKFVYKNNPFVLTENILTDGLGTFKVEDLPAVKQNVLLV